MLTSTTSISNSTRTDSEPSQTNAGREVQWLLRIVATMFIVTIIITWKLWRTDRPYPHAPLFEWLPQIPPPLDLALPIVLLVALAIAALARNPRWPLYIALGTGLLLAIFDQTRWQPYVLHFMVILGSLLMLPWKRRNRWTDSDLEWGLMPARLLLIFTYLYSGLHKFNHEFLTWLFGWVTEPLLQWLNIPPTDFAQGLMIPMALLAAMIEAAAGILLMFRSTRRPAAIVLIAMHLFILLMLGPLGRGTNHAVWPWNVAMIAALWTLFVVRHRPAIAAAPRFLSRAWRESIRREGPAPSRAQSIATGAVIVLFGFLPLLSFADLWDSYLSFSIYSGMVHQARITMQAEDRSVLPPHAAQLIDDDGGFDPIYWAVAEFNATPYPEPRVMLAIGRELARRATHGDVYVQIASRPDPLTGERDVHTFRCPRGGGEPVEEMVE